MRKIMKKTFILFLLLGLACSANAQVTTQNYIRSRKMLNNTGTSYVDNIAYYDGLGRPFQTVTKSTQTGTVKERLATLQEYDAMGRETNAWLPTPVTADYVVAATLKSTAQGSTGYGDTRPYNETVYEASPLSRVTKQYGAGAAWYSGHPVATDYLTNTVSGAQACKLYTTDGNTLSGGSGYYTSGSLYVVKTTDEDGNISYTFTDKQGRTVLTRQMNGTEQLDTYFVYDVKGNLCFVLQPMYQTTANLSLYAFQYKYDERNRCIWKKLPGAEYINYEYNDADQLTFSQNGNQRTTGKWTFYVYDNLNRLVQQGESSGKNTSGTVMIRNYYDDYSFVGSSEFTGGYYIEGTVPADGLLTASVITTEGGNGEKVRYAYYYDEKGRLVKTVHSPLRGGTYLTTASYTFTDKPLQEQRIYFHGESGVAPIVEYINYSYDSSDRIQKITHQRMGVSGLAAVELVSYTYDSLGRMSAQTFHNGGYNSSYAYNVRGWLTGINNNKFSQTLSYGSYYNGNISSMNWTANGSSHSYAFTYDDVNRMQNATHGTGAYTEKVTGYDKNGNITGLQRYGNGLIDNLTYTYNGNRLTKVEDATGNTAGFKNGASQANEYTYDANGNLTKDSNKGIASITYNSLNLPQQIQYTNGFVVNYGYSADGVKQRVQHPNSGLPDVVYCGKVIYEGGAQKFLLTEEGYVDLSASTPVYYYYLKDHQGNNRVVINGSGTVVETNHYYPFGSTFASSSVQPYKYNGKELDTANGLNWYDYGARHYDAVLGRWHVVDPLAEKYYSTSPYGYCLNNPVKYIDPTGMFVGDYYDRQGNFLGTDGIDDNKIYLLNKDYEAILNDVNLLPILSEILANELKNNSSEVQGLIIQNRIEEGNNYTISEFYTISDGQDVNGYMLEPAGPSTSIANQDRRIPEGVYNIKNYSSDNYPNNFVLYNEDVSKDRKILYHIGNDGEDTEGCVLPGSIKGSGVVYDSKKKFDELRIFITGNGVLDVKTIINNKIKK